MEEKLKIVIRHGDAEAQFEGSYREVWESINRYLSELYPPLEVIKKLTGAIDVQELAEKLAGKVEIREGRIIVLLEADAKRKILLCLAAAYLGKALGIFDRDALTPKEIAGLIGLDERVARARLSELRRMGLAVKREGGLYTFTPASLKEILGEER